MLGRVRDVVQERGFFFLAAVDDDTQGAVHYFVHRSELRGIRMHQVKEDMLMEFEPTESPKGPRASNVRLAEEPTTEEAAS